MVALADWFIIPILPQLGTLSGPSTEASYYWLCPGVFAEYADLVLQLKCMVLSILVI
jgi:hypothetical protein